MRVTCSRRVDGYNNIVLLRQAKKEKEMEGETHRGVWNEFVRWRTLLEEGFRFFGAEVLHLVSRGDHKSQSPPHGIQLLPNQKAGGQKLLLTTVRIFHQNDVAVRKN